MQLRQNHVPSYMFNVTSVLHVSTETPLSSPCRMCSCLRRPLFRMPPCSMRPRQKSPEIADPTRNYHTLYAIKAEQMAAVTTNATETSPCEMR